MPAPHNPLKAQLAAKQLTFGCWLGFGDAHAADVATTADFDWFVIDNEHAPNDLRSTLAQLRVVQASSAQAIVRLPIGETWMIKQYLDLGVQNLLIPMVESAEQAASLVQAMRYPPEGVRGVGAALARASRYSGIPDYLHTANAELCLIVQVESRAGIAALDEILAVDGVDGVFIGPSDLSADMGFAGQLDAPPVRETIDKALAKIHASDKAAGLIALDLDYAAHCAKQGARFIATAIDITLFANTLRKAAAESQTIKQAFSGG